MKRNLLFILFAMIYTIGNAQVVFYVNAPSPLEGNYTLTYVEQPDWNVADLNDPANAIPAGELMMIFDSSVDSDSLICEPPVVTDVTGKVAVLYRGACEFGAKALAAENAGAIAVVIINHTGEPVGMGAGADGGSVTIPVVMISEGAGASLRPAIEAGGLTAFIGNKTGFFTEDLGIKADGVVRAPRASNIALLSQDETEFESQVGCWITNFGSNDQTGVVLTATVTLDGTELYNESSAGVDIISGDSAYVSLPVFSETSYDVGYYEMVYTASSGATEEFPGDNVFDANFRMSETLYSFGNIPDEAAGPENITYYRPSDVGGDAIQQCVAFQDANASRVAVQGMTFSASTNAETIDGEEVTIYLYEWTLQFEDLDDPDYTGVDDIDLDLLASGVYEYVGGDLENENVYQAFEEVLTLEDDSRYLFCIAYESEDMFVGYNAPKLDYSETIDTYLQPEFPNTAGDGEWFLVGFGTDIAPGIAVHMINANAVGVEEVVENTDITPYPNPAIDFIQIPLNDVSGLTTVQIFDISGKLVETQSITVTPGEVLKFNVSNLENGVYTFGLRYENGNVSNFNVVIAK